MEQQRAEIETNSDSSGTDPHPKFANTVSDSVPQSQLSRGKQSDQLPSGMGNSVLLSTELVAGSDHNAMTSSVPESNAYVHKSPAATTTSFSFIHSMATVKGTLGRWGKAVREATRKTEDLAGNTWQHLKTSPSFAEAAMGRIAQSTKVFVEGGYDKIYRLSFETEPDETLKDAFACYLSTSVGPVMGTLFVSTDKLAYCSDNPLSYKNDQGRTEWSYYKVIIPLDELKSINPSTSIVNSAEKYIQIISEDNHEFWFMGFLHYDGSVKCLQDALEAHKLVSDE